MERLQTNSKIKSEYLKLLSAMQSVDDSRKEHPNLEVLETLRQGLEGGRFGYDEIEKRLAVDEFIIRLLTKHDLGMFGIYDSMDKNAPGMEIDRWVVKDEIFRMLDAKVLVWNPDRSWGLSPELRDQLK